MMQQDNAETALVTVDTYHLVVLLRMIIVG